MTVVVAPGSAGYVLPSSVVSGTGAAAFTQPVATGSNGYAWQAKNIVDARDYGLVGDGVTDDTAHLQAAINAANAFSGGGIVDLPAATILLSGVLTLLSNVELRGKGTLTVLAPSYAAATNAAVITNQLTAGNSNITLRNFRLTRAGNNVEHGILLNGVTNLLVDGVEIVGVPSVTSGALAVSGVLPGGSGATRMLSQDVRIVNCLFQSANNFGVQLSFVLNASVTGCVFDDCYREAVGVEPESSCTATNVSIAGNTFTMSTLPAGGSATGMIVITESSGGTLSNVSVSGNTLTNLTASATDGNPGITVLTANGAPRGVTITGNTLTGMNGNGLNIGSASYGTQGVMITGNTITNCNAGNSQTGQAGAGISLRGATFCTVIGNFIKGANHTAGVYETSTGVGRNIIAYNQLLDSTAAYLLLAGSGSTAYNNNGHNAGSGNRVGVTLASAAYTMAVTDQVVGVTATGAHGITLPAAQACSQGAVYTIADESASAGTTNIVVTCQGADTFTDTTTSKTIAVNGGVLIFYPTGATKWEVLLLTAAVSGIPAPQLFTTAGTFVITVPAGVNHVRGSAVSAGAGGGGGGSATTSGGVSTQTGGGGGGSAMPQDFFSAVTPGATITLIVGVGVTGGNGGAANNNPGTSGATPTSAAVTSMTGALALTCPVPGPGILSLGNSTAAAAAGDPWRSGANTMPGSGAASTSGNGTLGFPGQGWQGPGGDSGFPASTTLGGNGGKNLGATTNTNSAGNSYTASTTGGIGANGVNPGAGGAGGGGGSLGGAGGNGGNGAPGGAYFVWLP